MGAQILCLGNLHREVCVCALSDYCQSVFASFPCAEVCEFINFTSCLETEVFKQIECGIFADYGYVEFSCFHNHVMGVVCLIHTDAELIRFRCSLYRRIDDAAVILFSVLCRKNEQPVTQFVHCFLIHCFLLLSMSNYVAYYLFHYAAKHHCHRQRNYPSCEYVSRYSPFYC